MRKAGRKGKASKWPQRDADIGLCRCQMQEVPWIHGLAQAQASLTRCLVRDKTSFQQVSNLSFIP